MSRKIETKSIVNESSVNDQVNYVTSDMPIPTPPPMNDLFLTSRQGICYRRLLCSRSTEFRRSPIMTRSNTWLGQNKTSFNNGGGGNSGCVGAGGGNGSSNSVATSFRNYFTSPRERHVNEKRIADTNRKCAISSSNMSPSLRIGKARVGALNVAHFSSSTSQLNTKRHEDSNSFHLTSKSRHVNSNAVRLNSKSMRTNSNESHLNSSRRLNSTARHLNSSVGHLNSSVGHLNSSVGRLDTNCRHLTSSVSSLNVTNPIFLKQERRYLTSSYTTLPNDISCENLQFNAKFTEQNCKQSRDEHVTYNPQHHQQHHSPYPTRRTYNESKTLNYKDLHHQTNEMESIQEESKHNDINCETNCKRNCGTNCNLFTRNRSLKRPIETKQTETNDDFVKNLLDIYDDLKNRVDSFKNTNDATTLNENIASDTIVKSSDRKKYVFDDDDLAKEIEEVTLLSEVIRQRGDAITTATCQRGVNDNEARRSLDDVSDEIRRYRDKDDDDDEQMTDECNVESCGSSSLKSSEFSVIKQVNCSNKIIKSPLRTIIKLAKIRLVNQLLKWRQTGCQTFFFANKLLQIYRLVINLKK